MKRGGSAVICSTGARAPVALLLQLVEARTPRGHEPVLGRDEVAVQQDERRDGEEFEEEGHAPLSGARVLGGLSSSNRIYAAV